MFRSLQFHSEPSSRSPDPHCREPEMSQLCKTLLGLSWINMMQHGTQPRVLELDG